MDKKRETKQEVIKHSAAIQVQNSMTLLQRRAWNVLLAHAYDGLSIEEEHSIRVQHLMEVLEFHSKNEDYLKEALEALVGCKVQWSVLDKDGEYEWGITTLLAQAKIRRGICIYAYSPELRRRLHNPRMYARLSLSMQNKFESKHAQALWELCADYLGSVREYGETPFIPLETFRKLMGIPEGMYPEFMRLNEKVIKPAIAEINRVCDFRVKVDYQRQGRKVTALKFKIWRVALLPEQNNAQGKLFPDMEDMPVIVKDLKDVGIAPHEAWEIWQQGFGYVQEGARPTGVDEDPETAFIQYIREKIHLLKRRQVSGKVENSTGFLLDAIKKNYANPEFIGEQQQKEAQKQAQNRKAKARELERLEAQRQQTRYAHEDAIHAHCARMIEAAPGVLDEAVTALREKNGAFWQEYSPGNTPLKDYRARPSLYVPIENVLAKRHPEHFRALYDARDAELAALDEKVAALAS